MPALRRNKSTPELHVWWLEVERIATDQATRAPWLKAGVTVNPSYFHTSQESIMARPFRYDGLRRDYDIGYRRGWRHGLWLGTVVSAVLHVMWWAVL